jgi:hypothetical protein
LSLCAAFAPLPVLGAGRLRAGRLVLAVLRAWRSTPGVRCVGGAAWLAGARLWIAAAGSCALVSGRFAEAALHRLHALDEIAGAGQRVRAGVALSVSLALHAIARLTEPRCGIARIRGCARVTACGCTPHGVRGLLGLAGRFGKVAPVLLSRQTFKATCCFFGLVGQRSLSGPVAAGLPVRGALTLAFRFLLLPLGEVLQSLGDLVELPIRRLLLAALEGLVLISQLVHLEAEEIGQVARLRRAAAAAVLAHRHANLAVGFFGALQRPQRLLFGGQRGFGLAGVKLGLGRTHRGCGVAQR